MKKKKLVVYIHLLLLALIIFSFAQSKKKVEPLNIKCTMTSDYYIYISDTSHCIAIYKIQLATGDLRFMKKVDVDGQPGSLTVDPTHSYLYAAIRSTNSISSFRIHARNGDLTLLNTIHVAMNPVCVRTDRTGKYLFAADNNKNIVSVFFIGQTGAVQDDALQTITTADFPHSVQVDPTNRFLYIPCRTGEMIHGYNFDSITGTLTGNFQNMTTPDSTGPRHCEFHTALNVVYFVNEFGRSVTAYRIDTSRGTLSAFQTLSLISPNVAKPKAPNKGGADIHLTPDHRFLFASNRDPDNIIVFSVDSLSGMLTLVSQYKTESTPRAFAIEPTGKFIYVGGQSSGKLTSYRIDASTGQLTHIKTYNVGESLVWVLIVQINPVSKTDN